MFKIHEDDKEFLGAIFSLIFIILSFIVVIQNAPRRAGSTPKKYDLICTVSYVKIPFKECVSREVR